MRQQSAEGLAADISGSDLRVTVDVRAQGSFRIVGVKDRDVLQAEDVVSLPDCAAEFGRLGDVETGRQQMSSVETVADGHVAEWYREIANRTQFLELAA